MKKEDVPQDLSSLGKITKEVCFATDESGHYTTELSKGWDVKITANEVAWHDIEQRVADARQKVLNGEASPILFFMERSLMDPVIIAGYTGFWVWTVKRHLKPGPFKRLSQQKLQRYADTFNITVEELKTMTLNGDKV